MKFIHHSKGKTLPAITFIKSGKKWEAVEMKIQTTNNRITFVGDYSDGKIRIAAARCSDKDHFSRKIGREIAEERLDKGVYIYEDDWKEYTIHDFMDFCNGVITTIETFPETVRHKIYEL